MKNIKKIYLANSAVTGTIAGIAVLTMAGNDSLAMAAAMALLLSAIGLGWWFGGDLSRKVATRLEEERIAHKNLHEAMLATLLESQQALGEGATPVWVKQIESSRTQMETATNQLIAQFTTITGRQLLAELQLFMTGKPDETSADSDKAVSAFACDQGRIHSMGGGKVDSGNWHLSLRFGADSLRDGMDPLSFIR
jgi:hypothetical protein